MQSLVRFYPYVGGVENYVYNLSKSLLNLGHDVKVLCSNEGYSGGDNKELAGLKVKRMRYVCKIANTNITPSALLHLILEEYDILHTHLPTPWISDLSAFAAKIKSCPLILTYHNDITSFGFWKIFSKSYNLFLIDFLLKNSSRIIVSQPRYLKSPRLVKYCDKLKLLPPGVDTEKFKPNPKIEKEEIFLFVGKLDRYHKYKGLLKLLKAIKNLKDKKECVHLLIVGSGELRDYYVQTAHKLGISDCVSFVGSVDEDRLIELYNKCCCLILPSESKLQEGFGLVAIEALSCGTPVIVSNVVGVSSDVEEYGCGIVVRSTDNEICKAIETIRMEDCSKMGKRGRRLVLRKYSWHSIAKRVEEIYFEAVEENRK